MFDTGYLILDSALNYQTLIQYPETSIGILYYRQYITLPHNQVILSFDRDFCTGVFTV